MAEFNELFGGDLDSKMSFLDEKKQSNNDGIYRIDLSKAKDKKKGYRSVIRFLPNLMKDGKVGQAAIEKITHYVDIKNAKELSGWFDSAKNFNEKCPLTDLYYTMTNSKNAILQEKAKCLKYSKKYYSYVLVVEDEQQPELKGKIMIFQYGKTIKDKILAEKNGEISGVSCNVFDLAAGKDFVVLVKEISTGDETYPDYKNSMFKPETSSLPVYFEDKGVFKNVPTSTKEVNGREILVVDSKAQSMVAEFLMKRDHELEDFAPKRLTEEQQAKINEISAYLTGKSTSNNTSNLSSSSKPSSDDFDFDSVPTTKSKTITTSVEEDDFFSDFT
jgi:hypothetical protein